MARWKNETAPALYQPLQCDLYDVFLEKKVKETEGNLYSAHELEQELANCGSIHLPLVLANGFTGAQLQPLIRTQSVPL